MLLGFRFGLFWVELFSSEMFLSSRIWKALGIIHWPVVHGSMHLVNEESMCNSNKLLFSFFKQNPKTPGIVLATCFGFIFEIFWTEEIYWLLKKDLFNLKTTLFKYYAFKTCTTLGGEFCSLLLTYSKVKILFYKNKGKTRKKKFKNMTTGATQYKSGTRF